MSEQTLEKIEQKQKSHISEQPVYKAPCADICEKEDSYFIYLEMPGVAAEDVDIKLEKNRMTVVGQTKISMDMGNCLYQEYLPVDYKRVFKLPESIDKDKVIAKMTNGLLKLTLMKSETAKPIQIPVVTG